MNRARITLQFLLLIAFGFLFASSAFAQATRTWVSGVGDDANPCSRTAPCKTFPGAISKTAAGGTIDVLDPGGFGAVTITKSITLENVGAIAGVLVSGTNGINVNAGPNDTVVLRGLSIDGVNTGLTGVKFNSGAKLIIERCVIQNFTQNGIDFDPAAVSSQLVVSDSTINNNTAAGIQVLAASPGTANVQITRTRLLQNAFGVLAKNGIVAISDSIMSGNTQAGAKAFGTTAAVQMSVDNSTVSGSIGSGVGIISQGALANVLLSRSTLTNNGTGALAAAGVLNTSGDNRIFGNTNPTSGLTTSAQQ